MDEKPSLESKKPPAVRWRMEDLEDQQPQPAARPALKRAGSRASMSIHSVRSNSGVDPAAALPVQYRTVSIDIDDYKRQAEFSQRAQKSAAADLADLEWHTASPDEAVRRLTTSVEQGLSPDQIKRRTVEYDKNTPAPPETHLLQQWFGYFFRRTRLASSASPTGSSSSKPQRHPLRQAWFAFGNPEGVDPEFYAQKLNEASSIYFVTLVVIQWFNLLACRTRRLSIFQHPPLLNKATQNLYLFPAILFALVMAFFWLYIPPLQEVLGTAEVPVGYWFLPMAFGLGILLLDDGRKSCVRKWPGGFFAKIAW